VRRVFGASNIVNQECAQSSLDYETNEVETVFRAEELSSRIVLPVIENMP
jgi:hypothetical protein